MQTSGQEWPQARVLSGKALDKSNSRHEVTSWYRQGGKVRDDVSWLNTGQIPVHWSHRTQEEGHFGCFNNVDPILTGFKQRGTRHSNYISMGLAAF